MTKQPISSITNQLDASPTPRHLVAYISDQLNNAGFTDYSNYSKQSINQTDSGYIANCGSLIAWRTGTQTAGSGFRIVGAHTDSPCFKLKPNAEDRRFGFNTLQVEIYGSPLINSWLDRDLGIAGHVVLKNGGQKLFCSINPVARISQLAIHLDREVNERGLVLDKQLHLSPTWSTDSKSPKLIDWVAIQTKTKSTDIAHLDAQLFDANKATVIGIDDSLLASGRLDNQASCWAAISAIIESPASSSTHVVALFDHEEVGSQSATGAGGPFLEHTLERLSAGLGLSRIDYLEALRASSCISADNAHAVHPNYPERHDLANAPIINHGPAIKMNSNQRYATSAESAAIFVAACNTAKVEHQIFVSRNNMPCGTTIGPITASRLGINTVDVGLPQLSMHSAREVCGVNDLVSLQLALKAYFK